MKKIIRTLFGLFDLELSKKKVVHAGSVKVPVGEMKGLLKDLKHRGLSIKTLLDIGANKAEWSGLFKEVYPDANCFLIEPLVECEAKLMEFVKQNPGSRYFLCAAGSKREKLTITIWDDLYGSSLLPQADEIKRSQGKQRVIDVVTVDELIKDQKLPFPELVKIDVQGFELEALKGAVSLFGRTEVLILEVSLYSFDGVPGMPEFYDVVNFMYERDYVVYDFPGFLRRPYDGALGQCDVCFVKKNGKLRSSNKWN